MSYMLSRLSFDAGFAPDADPLQPGVCTDMLNMVPSGRGMRTLPIAEERDGDEQVTVTGAVTASVVRGYFAPPVVRWTPLTYEYCATESKVFRRDYATGLWTDVSRGSALAYSAFAWNFEPISEFVGIAAASSGDGYGIIPLQQYDAANACTNIAGAPTCGVITSADRFFLAFNGAGGFNDSWNCSARDSATSWTTSAATLAAGGRLVDPVGPIVCAIPMNSDVIVFKSRAIIRGRFVRGSAEVWEWQRLPFKAGAASPRAACSMPDGRVAFIGIDGCFVFDGSNVVDVLAGKARTWFQSRLPSTYDPRFSAVYDPLAESVWFTFPYEPAASSEPVCSIIWHVPSGRLGVARFHADIIGEMPVVGADMYRTVGFIDSVERKQWVFKADDIASINNGLGFTGIGDSYIVSGDFGDAYSDVEVASVLLDAPTRANGTITSTLKSRALRAVSGERESSQYVISPDTMRFDVRGNGHWHRVTFTLVAAVETTGVWIEHTPTGRRK